MNPLFLEAPTLAQKLTRMQYCGATEDFLSHMDSEISWFGCGEDEFSLQYDEIAAYFLRAKHTVPKYEVWDEAYHLASDLGEICVVTGRFRVREDAKSAVHQRITYVFRAVGGKLKVIHIHASVPYKNIQKGEIPSKDVGKDTYAHLNRLLQNKSEQIDVMMSAVTGGLKGSRDDNTYSYFYVSDALCSMLGYTKDEFMEMSGGSAVGAVYPPDLKSALAQCEVCFKQGECYASEYRMQRKDGSLIWVLDSGRKVVNEEGKTVINSIILDITEKKAADAEILKQRNFLRALYNTMPAGLVQLTVADPPRILNVNRAAAEIFGYACDETETLRRDGGMDVFSLVYFPDAAAVRRVLARMHAQQGSVRYEHRIVTKDGEVRWLDVSGEKLSNEESAEVYQLIFTDISEKKTAELEMKREWEQERERYRLTVENSDDIVFEYEIAEDRFNYYLKDAEAGGKAVKHVICPYRDKIYERALVEAEDAPKVIAIVCEGRLRSAEFRMRCGAGKTWTWVYMQGAVVSDDQGNPARIVGIVRDISAVKHREEEYANLQGRFSMALRSSYEEVFEGNLLNDELYFMNFSDMGFSRNKIERGFRATFAWSAEHLLHRKDKKKFETFYEAALADPSRLCGAEASYCECRHKGADGRYSWRLYTLHRADWDDHTLIFFIRDIDRLKREEERTRQTLKDALFAAEAANRAKSDFLSRMSHDIRTPMNAIIGMNSIAQTSLGEPKKVADCLAKIGVASKFLLALINDILDMSRIESGKLALVSESFVFEEFINNLTELVCAQAQAKELRFETVVADAASVYVGDTLRLHQVLMNLLSNALKFTDKGGVVRLQAHRLECGESADLLQFIVEDSGIGMEENFLRCVFEPFEQERKAGARNYEGSGLGLSIARNLVHMMNGAIRVESQVGKGTKFIVELSLHREGVTARGARKHLEHRRTGVPQVYAFHGARILLVEDNEINLEIAKAILAVQHLQVESAENGQMAVEMFERSAPGSYDLILMDIRMPVKDGLVATKEIRALAHPDAAHIPIVAMTANVFKEDMDKAKAAGMNGYVIKPIENEKLYEVLDCLLSKGTEKRTDALWAR